MKGGTNADIQTNQEETTECKRLHKEPIYMPNFTFYFIAPAVSRLSLEVSKDETNRD
jgi:hypothetical protein